MGTRKRREKQIMRKVANRGKDVLQGKTHTLSHLWMRPTGNCSPARDDLDKWCTDFNAD